MRTRYLFGIFRAVTWPQENIEPTAWGVEAGGGSKYPLQVRIRVEQQGVLRLPEERVRTLLEYRGSFNRFDLRLSKVQADGLAQLFVRMGEPRGLGMVGGGGSCAAHGGASSTGAARSPAERTERRERNGLIFVCDPSTEEECLSRRLLGLPKSQSTLLSKLRDTSLLFLFNVRSRQLLGVLQPEGPAGLDLEPAAWGGGRFPVQVRFTPAQPSGQLLMLPESVLGDVLRYRSPSTRFDLLLRGKPLDRLVALFAHHGVPYAGAAGSSSGARGAGGSGASQSAWQAAAPQTPPLPTTQPPPLYGSAAEATPPGVSASELGGGGGGGGGGGAVAAGLLAAGMSPPSPDSHATAAGAGVQSQPPPASYAAHAAQQPAPAPAPATSSATATASAPTSAPPAEAAGAALAPPLDQMLGQLSLQSPQQPPPPPPNTEPQQQPPPPPPQ